MNLACIHSFHFSPSSAWKHRKPHCLSQAPDLEAASGALEGEAKAWDALQVIVNMGSHFCWTVSHQWATFRLMALSQGPDLLFGQHASAHRAFCLQLRWRRNREISRASQLARSEMDRAANLLGPPVVSFCWGGFPY